MASPPLFLLYKQDDHAKALLDLEPSDRHPWLRPGHGCLRPGHGCPRPRRPLSGWEWVSQVDGGGRTSTPLPSWGSVAAAPVPASH